MYLLIYFTRLPILYFNINIITCKKEANSSNIWTPIACHKVKRMELGLR